MLAALRGAANIWKRKWRPIPKLSPPGDQLREQKCYLGFALCDVIKKESSAGLCKMILLLLSQ
jgi:hypothetical protein